MSKWWFLKSKTVWMSFMTMAGAITAITVEPKVGAAIMSVFGFLAALSLREKLEKIANGKQ